MTLINTVFPKFGLEDYPKFQIPGSLYTSLGWQSSSCQHN